MNNSHAQPAVSAPPPLVIEPLPDGVCYRLPRSQTNVPSIILMLMLLTAVIALPLLVQSRFGSTTPQHLSIAMLALSAFVGLYLIWTILIALFGSTQVIVTGGRLRVRQTMGFIPASLSCQLADLRYLGVSRSYAYKQTNHDPVDLFYIRKGSWRQTALAVYQDPLVMKQLMEDLRQRLPALADRIITVPPDDALMGVIDWLIIHETQTGARADPISTPPASVRIRSRPDTLTLRAQGAPRKLPSFLTHPVFVLLLLAGLLGLGLYHLGPARTLEYAKPAAALVGVFWVLGGLNRFFIDHDRVIVRVTPTRLQVCQLKPFAKRRLTVMRSRLRSVRVGRAEMAGGFCLKILYRGLTRQTPECLEHRTAQELAFIAGAIEWALARPGAQQPAGPSVTPQPSSQPQPPGAGTIGPIH